MRVEDVLKEGVKELPDQQREERVLRAEQTTMRVVDVEIESGIVRALMHNLYGDKIVPIFTASIPRGLLRKMRADDLYVVACENPDEKDSKYLRFGEIEKVEESGWRD